MMTWLIVVILSVVIPQIHLDPNISKRRIIEDCQMEHKMFIQHEKEYADKNIIQFMINVQHDGTGTTPSLPRTPVSQVLKRSYAKETQQRPFECIHDSLKGTTESRLEEIENYKELVGRCRSENEVLHCDRFIKYRTFDGTCNNLKNPKWGSALHCLRRLMPAYYEGVAGYRQSVCGGPLPNPRVISFKYHTSGNNSNNELTNLVPFFGQLVVHEMTDVPMTTVENMSINCCADVDRKHLHPQCAPIHIPRDDPFYSNYSVTCFNFIRSAPCNKCSAKGKRIQMNAATSFIDGSVIYGSDEETSRKLRAFDGTGKLISRHKKAGELLPRAIILKFLCGSVNESQYCFRAGDRKVNQHTPLMSLETLYVRQHNRIATELKRFYPKWSEEVLFQETRKIVIALEQVVVFKELLPVLIGPHLMSHYNLWIRKEGYTHYNPRVDPTMMVEFNTAAYRLHSLVDPNITEAAIDGNKTRLRDMFSRASPMYNNYMDDVLEGLSQRYCQQYDRLVTPDITNFMYRRPDQHGLDIATININRGLDHGLPPYVDTVHFLSGGKIKMHNFNDLNQFIEQGNIDRLKEIYCDVRDIDMWVGMNSERVPRHMTLGPTAAKIIAMQFHNLKYGDRFYFEHDGIFTKDQLRTLRDFKYSQLLCEFTNITLAQEWSFKLPSRSNPLQKCSNIARLDLSAWKPCTRTHA